MAEILGEALEMDLGQAAIVIEHVDTVQNAGTVTHADEVIYNVPEAPEIVVPTGDIDANTAARHTHGNKALLDTYTQTEENLADAVSKKHNHSNKTILDGIASENLLPDVDSDDNGKHLVVSGGAWVRTKKLYPELTAAEKTAIADLARAYSASGSGAFRERVHYEYNHNRNAFDSAANCFDTTSGKYLLNCNTFVEMILMGRKTTDFPLDGNSYSNKINTEFDFGYYPQFLRRQKAGHLAARDSQGNVTGYYGFRAPNKTDQNNDYTNSYSNNSYYTGSSHLYGQTFNSYMNANDLALELKELGCEIPLSELDVGDILFSKSINPAFYHERVFWRQISHTFLCYGFTNSGTPNFVECTDAANTIVRCGYSDSFGDYDKTQASKLHGNIVMVARFPHAWGIPSNVPEYITRTPSAYEAQQEVANNG